MPGVQYSLQPNTTSVIESKSDYTWKIKKERAALKKLMESNPHWQVEAWMPRNRTHSREIHINDQDEAVVREVILYEEPLFKSQDNQKQSSRAFFSDGSYPNLSSTPLSDYPHLDIYIQGEKV